MNGEQTIRAFICIPVSPELLGKTAEIQGSLSFQGVRWAKRDQIHLTLKFLGDIPAASVGDLEAAIRRACQGVKPFRLSLEGLGCFPGPKRPSVVWIGVGGDTATLQQLQKQIENETSALAGRQEAREFHPHLTVGRVKNLPFRELPRLGAQIQSAQVGALGDWTVEAVHLMQSELLPDGARHTSIASVRLE